MNRAFLLQIVLAGAMAGSAAPAASDSDPPVAGISGIALDDESLLRLSSEGLRGSGEAARRVSSHYLLASNNRVEALYWALIAAENGDPTGQYNAWFLLHSDQDLRNRERSIFWLRKAASGGVELAIEELRRSGRR